MGGNICLKKVSESICMGGVCSEVPSLKQQKKTFFLCVVNCFPLSTPFLIFIESLPTKVKILFQNWIADDCQSLLNGFWLPPIDRICQDLGERICLIVKNKFDLLCLCSSPVMHWETCWSWSTPESRHIGLHRSMRFPFFPLLDSQKLALHKTATADCKACELWLIQITAIFGQKTPI